jgi:hypothetical protein
VVTRKGEKEKVKEKVHEGGGFEGCFGLLPLGHDGETMTPAALHQRKDQKSDSDIEEEKPEGDERHENSSKQFLAEKNKKNKDERRKEVS